MDILACELKKRIQQQEDLCIIDVREVLEYYTYNIGGIHIPIGQLLKELNHLKINKTDEVILVCQRGIRSKTGQKIMQKAGYLNVRNLTGGLSAYRRINE